METQQAEIASSTASAEVDSGAQATETEVSATSAAETGAAKSDGAERTESPEKKRDDVQERFDKLTRERYEAQARAEIAEERRAALEARLAALEQEKAKPDPVAPDSPPTLEQFGYDEAKYHAAVYDHLTKTVGAKIRDEILGEMKQTETQRAQQEAQSAWEKRQGDFIKSNPDYVDKVLNARHLPISKELQAELMQMDDGPQLAYYLVENSEKALAMRKLPLSAQLRELGRIQAHLEAKKAAPPVSKAPPPVAKVDANTAPSSFKVDSAESDNLSDAEWMRRRNAQELARRRNRASS